VIFLSLLWGIEIQVKVSLCLTKHHAMKTYRESRGTAPRILNLGTDEAE